MAVSQGCFSFIRRKTTSLSCVSMSFSVMAGCLRLPLTFTSHFHRSCLFRSSPSSLCCKWNWPQTFKKDLDCKMRRRCSTITLAFRASRSPCSLQTRTTSQLRQGNQLTEAQTRRHACAFPANAAQQKKQISNALSQTHVPTHPHTGIPPPTHTHTQMYERQYALHQMLAGKRRC